MVVGCQCDDRFHWRNVSGDAVQTRDHETSRDRERGPGTGSSESKGREDIDLGDAETSGI
ncbi:hypothetical protein EI94DRAFT_1724454 [Lactarius quietus]|nr:hypothetical protein EI94DRAFT_1724454 [Lactarius quietus]